MSPGLNKTACGENVTEKAGDEEHVTQWNSFWRTVELDGTQEEYSWLNTWEEF